MIRIDCSIILIYQANRCLKESTSTLSTDYRRLNTYTKKIGFVLPNIDNILDKLGHSKFFISLDLQSALHQLRINDFPHGVLNSRGEEIRGFGIHKTAFCTQYGTFEYVVIYVILSRRSPEHLSKICFVDIRSYQETLVTSLY